MQEFRNAAEELHRVVDAGDREKFRNLFRDVEDYFGDFSKTALEESSFLIDRLVERT